MVGPSHVISNIKSVRLAPTSNKINCWLKLKHCHTCARCWTTLGLGQAGHHSSETFTLCHPSQFQPSLLCLIVVSTSNILIFLSLCHFSSVMRWDGWWRCVADQLHLLLPEKVSWIALAPCAVMSSLWFLWERPPPQPNLAQAPL